MSTVDKPNILILESDDRIRELFEEEFECDFNCTLYCSLEEMKKSDLEKKKAGNYTAAIIEMPSISVDELAKLSQVFKNIPEAPVFLTLNYNSDYQLLESYLKSWTKHIFFRPFNVETLIETLKYHVLKDKQTKSE